VLPLHSVKWKQIFHFSYSLQLLKEIHETSDNDIGNSYNGNVMRWE